MTDNYSYRFSIFTATYNRGEKLYQVYQNLLNQTFKDFEWVIINDGSSDNTDEIVKQIIQKSPFQIQYLNKPNGGKHTAWREATKLFRGRYVVGADDDDTILPNALELYDRHWKILENDEKYDSFWEIRSRVKREDGLIFTPQLPLPWFDSDYNEINYKFRFNGLEMSSCRKVEVLRTEAAVPLKFFFDDEVSNFPEGIRWSRAARKYKTRFIPDITRIYNLTPDSLTKSSKNQRNKKRTYNTLVGSLYALKEQKDLMMKFKKLKYIKECCVCGYTSICLRIPVSKLPLSNYEKNLIHLLKPLLYIAYKIRG